MSPYVAYARRYRPRLRAATAPSPDRGDPRCPTSPDPGNISAPTSPDPGDADDVKNPDPGAYVPTTYLPNHLTSDVIASPVLILGLGPFPAPGVAGAGVAVLASYATGAAVLACYPGAGTRGGAAGAGGDGAAPRAVGHGAAGRHAGRADHADDPGRDHRGDVDGGRVRLGGAGGLWRGAAAGIAAEPDHLRARLGGDRHDRGQSRCRPAGPGAGRRAGERAGRRGDRARLRRGGAAAAPPLGGPVRRRPGGAGGRRALSAHGGLDPAAAWRGIRARVRADGRRAAGDGDRAEARGGVGRRLFRRAAA